ncbi:MAG: hypothetical protein J1F23_07120 [Oscillospiraceae bacterium]|nr:hypothetical protein [Oscillospiraceae bacterium]
MNKKARCLLIFLFGGVIYGAIEVISRGYTHWSMIITGGSALLSIYIINEALTGISVFIKAIAGAIVITTLELTVGIIVNKIFMFGVWDYSELPINFLGQISVIFSVGWYFLSIFGFFLCDKFNAITALQKS